MCHSYKESVLILINLDLKSNNMIKENQYLSSKFVLNNSVVNNSGENALQNKCLSY